MMMILLEERWLTLWLRVVRELQRRSLAPSVFSNIRSSSRRRMHFVTMHRWMSIAVTRTFLLVNFHSVCIFRRIIRSLVRRRRLWSNDNVRSVRSHRPAAAAGGGAALPPSTRGALQGGSRLWFVTGRGIVADCCCSCAWGCGTRIGWQRLSSDIAAVRIRGNGRNTGMI